MKKFQIQIGNEGLVIEAFEMKINDSGCLLLYARHGDLLAAFKYWDRAGAL